MNEFADQELKKVGVAISGGFIRAAAAIGVIEVLQENNVPINVISGSSSGAIVAGAYACGKLEELKARLVNGRRRDYFRIIFEPTLPRRGFLKGERNEKFFEEFVGEKTFAETNIPLILAVTDLTEMAEVVLTEGKISKAIRACTSVPGIFVPVEHDEKVLIDGANFNTIPSEALYQHGVNYVIAVYVAKPPSPITRFLGFIHQVRGGRLLIKKINDRQVRKQHLNIFRLIVRAVRLSVVHIKNFYHEAYRYDVIIRPELKRIRRYQVKSVEYCIAQGRRSALEVLPQIKKDLGL
ncbi:MAG: patatin-like phospholipase family protein [Patescibacteria group bacterium]|jgi:NTE family protein|nr:patatin-like phospholipase family protein [Patescibacteria group bacterium]